MDLIKIAKALSDKSRFDVLKKIVQKKEISCGEIANVFNLSQPTVSHHLKVLLECNLVQIRKDGQYSFFSINKKVLENYTDSLKTELLK